MNKTDLLKKLSAGEFALWDLHLYLDTHPGDLAAVGLYNKYYKKYMMLREEYESTCGKLSARNAQGVEWLKDPWPWEKGWCDC